MVQAIIYNSVVMYLPAMALNSIFGISQHLSILVFGLLCVLYSVVGGLKAVVWADFFQGLMIFGCILSIATIGTYEAGGVNELFSTAFSGGRLNLGNIDNVDLSTRHTYFGLIVGGTLNYICMTSMNQVQLQRALSLPTLGLAQWSIILCTLYGTVILFLAGYMGFVIYSAYGPCDPFLNGQIHRRDIILMHYVADRLGYIPGLRGLFVAGIVSATLSTLSSFANSMSAVALQDFATPLHRKFCAQTLLSGRQSLHLAKIFTCLFGLVCIVLAYAVEKANSRLLQIALTLLSAVGIPFLASFVLGIYTRFTNSTGINIAIILSVAFGGYIVVVQAFLSAALEPITSVVQNEQCFSVYNMTLDPSQLSSTSVVSSSFGVQKSDHTIIDGNNHPFLADTSYLMLPVLQFILMLLIAPAVSLATGGLRNKVPDKYVSV